VAVDSIERGRSVDAEQLYKKLRRRTPDSDNFGFEFLRRPHPVETGLGWQGGAPLATIQTLSSSGTNGKSNRVFQLSG
jgi:hypothetical protein